MFDLKWTEYDGTEAALPRVPGPVLVYEPNADLGFWKNYVAMPHEISERIRHGGLKEFKWIPLESITPTQLSALSGVVAAARDVNEQKPGCYRRLHACLSALDALEGTK